MSQFYCGNLRWSCPKLNASFTPFSRWEKGGDEGLATKEKTLIQFFN